jgi:uncharacterized RDD family membrane protein YckC
MKRKYLGVLKMSKYIYTAVVAAIVLCLITAAYIYYFAIGVIPPYQPYDPVPSYIIWIVLIILLVILAFAALKRPKKT